MTRGSATPESAQSRIEPHATPNTLSRVTHTMRTEDAARSRQPSSQVSGDIEGALLEAESHIMQTSTTSSDVENYFPYQDLFNTTVTIEYGEPLTENNKYTVHLEFLSCQSNSISRNFKRSEELRHHYEEAKEWSRNAKSLISQESDPDADWMDQAKILLKKFLKQYPLLEYQVPVRKRLELVTEEKFKDPKNWRGPADANKKRIHTSEVIHRIQLLKPEHVMEILKHLDQLLHKIETMEREKALSNDKKAAAQLRIILPSFDRGTVGCVVSWIYQQTLHFTNASQLYRIYELANTLGIKALAEICVNKLLGAATDSIRKATREGVSLRDLVDSTNEEPPPNEIGVHDPLAKVIPAVFSQVLKDMNAPKVLQTLVINAIADSRDIDLYSDLKTSFSRPLLEELGAELIRRNCGVKQEKAT